METVKIRCPNGHKLACPTGKLGQTAKCPKCGIKFLAAAPEESPPDPGELIHFLCPNGHELNGPQRLAGKAGQCPHCSERFQIPTLEELQAAAAAEGGEEFSLGEALPNEAAVQAEGYGFGEADYETAPEDSGPADPVSLSNVEIIDEPLPQHPMADVFTRLWQQRDGGVLLEVYLSGGACIKADRFAPRLSLGAHGVFATRQEDGRYTLNTIHWDCVQRVVMKDIDELPEEMFD